jgi:hypothetical protein
MDGHVHAAEPPPESHVEAVWKAQSIVFEYHSEGRTYRCDILEYKIKMILQRLGARERLELRRHACRDLAGWARFEVVMESPVEATEENVHEITRYDSKDELIARAHGGIAPQLDNLDTTRSASASASASRCRASRSTR